MNAQDVADYLQQHSEFFDEHATLFATLTVPHPHGGRAIPLAERQMITLREKNRGLELKVAELMRYGQENDAIAERLARWTRMLLLQRSPRLLPETLTGSLEEIFSVPHVALALWDAADEYADVARAADASPSLIAFVGTLHGPYCGTPVGEAIRSVALFHRPSTTQDTLERTTTDGTAADGETEPIASDVRSVALIPLHRGAAADPFGVLALGSADARRFHDGMGTDFLARIGENASAALTRLLR
ncbi:MAG: DUF484 family protein [Burkholderiaceae bacterium]